MATCFKGAMATAFPSLSPSRIRRVKNRCSAICSASDPNMAFNPNDPLLSTQAQKSPVCAYSFPFVESVLKRDAPRMVSPSEVEKLPSTYTPRRTRMPPPDLASEMFHHRIVYIGLPLVPMITELIIAELVYLQYSNPKAPIQLYINSTGTATDDGERVAMESEGFAIYDGLDLCKCKKRTLAIGCAIGMSCLLLAAGTKGHRFMLPHAHLAIKQPRLPPSGLVPADEVLKRAKIAIHYRDILVQLFAKHTGKSEEAVMEKMRNHSNMGPVEAKKFGVIDTVLWRGQEDMMKEMLPPSEWVKIPKDKRRASKDKREALKDKRGPLIGKLKT